MNSLSDHPRRRRTDTLPGETGDVLLPRNRPGLHSWKFLDEILNAILDPVFVKDRRHRWILLNDAYCRFMGHPREELIGKTDLDYFPREQAEVFYEKDDLVFQTGRENSNEEKFTDAQGVEHTIITKKNLYTDGEGNPYIVGVIRDVTALRSEEEKLRQQERLLAESQAVAHIGSAEWDLRSSRFTWSAELYRIYGLPEDEPLSYELIDGMTHPEDRPHVEERMRQAIESCRPFAFDYRIVRRDGGERILFARGEAVSDGKRSCKLIGTVQDVTEQKRAEEKLRQKEQELYQASKLEAVGRLAGGVAHDFNNLLTGILGMSEDLRAAMGPNDPRRADLDEIIKASLRAFTLTKQLLTFGRRQIARPRVLSLNRVISNIHKMLERIIGEDIRLMLDLGRIGPVRADAGQLEQILMNLVVNARDAMPQGGRITIRTAGAPGGFVALEVADTGSGMDSETVSHIFEPFFSTKSQERGTGLGLATVYGIVKQSGGEIEVSSEPGRGTTFRLLFPAVRQEPEEGPAGETVSRLLAGSETVLVVEDEDIVRKIVARRLKQEGYNVLEARHGTEALEIAKRHPASIQVVLTDIVMPEMSGPHLAEKLEALNPSIRVVYMSGYPADLISDRQTLPAGVPFIEKAGGCGSLIATIREVLDQPKEAKKDQ